MGFQTNRMLITFIVACVAVLTAGYVIGEANEVTPSGGVVIVDGTPGTVSPPTPVWPTATATATLEPVATATVPTVDFITPIPVDTLPSTGAGSTAREVNTSAHTGWHWSGGYVCFNNKLMKRYQWANAVQYPNGYGGYYWGHSWTGELAYMYPSGWCI
jgi:hypothetical protein